MNRLLMLIVTTVSLAAPTLNASRALAADPEPGSAAPWERAQPTLARIVGDAPLAEGFKNPPRTCSMVPLWSWNGRLEPEQLHWQIDQMVDKGVYGAFMHARAGINEDATPYFSRGWWDAVEASVEHASEVGFSAWLYDEDKWPSGSAGGRTVKRNPERNWRKGLARRALSVEGPNDVEICIPQARYVIAGKRIGKNQLDPDTLIDVTKFNIDRRHTLNTAATEGLRVAVVSDWQPHRLEGYCKLLGCKVVRVPSGQADTLDLDQIDVLISDVGTPGVGLPTETLRDWIRTGGGYIDFSHSEPTAGLYDLRMVIEPDAPDHRWLRTDHPIASTPNRTPDAAYTGRRWSDLCWRGGADFDEFYQVLADPRFDPPCISILAREEGTGRVVCCGATQACREPGAHIELLQNLLVYATSRDVSVTRSASAERPETRTWPCPSGKWLVIGYVANEINPAEVVDRPVQQVNYLNRDTVRDFIDITHEAYAERVGNRFGTTIPGVFFDEIHNTGVEIVWVEGFAERFRQRKGYDLIPLLPALAYDIGPRTPKVRCDYYDVYTTFYEEAWFRQMADWCDAHDLLLTGHTIEELGGYTTQGSYVRTMRHLHIPATDNEDFRYRWPRVIGSWKPKQMASLCHVYGRPLVGVEAMGGAGWSFTPDSARYGYNMLAAYGVNFFISHLFHYAQDKPDNVDDWPNSWFFRNPYWKYFKTFADHSRRLTYMLAGTDHVVDVAVLWPITNLWAGNGGGTAGAAIDTLVARQIDADVIDPDSLVRADITAGSLAIENMRYRVLVIPGVQCIRRDVADKIRAFIATGGILIVHDRWPTDSMDAGKDDPRIARLRTEAEARGIALSAVNDTARLVSEAIERDVIVAAGDADPLRYHHSRRDDKDIYWLVNSDRAPGSWRISFRAAGAPSLWQPEDGSIPPVSLFVRKNGRTEFDVTLDGRQGVFVVFDAATDLPPGGVEIAATNLDNVALVRATTDGAEFTGLLGPASAAAELTAKRHHDGRVTVLASKQGAPPAPKLLTLDRNWRFLPVGNQLDEDWRIDVDDAELELPVMHVRWERSADDEHNGWHRPDCNDTRWRKIKVLDTLHADAGADRYRSCWRARFISRYDYSTFQTRIGGPGLQCRKQFHLPAEPNAPGHLLIVCESPFRLIVNEKESSHEGSRQPQQVELNGLRTGPNTVTIIAEDVTALLAEGRIDLSPNQRLDLFTDATWQVSRDGTHWHSAWEYVAPPESPYGEPPHAWHTQPPTVVWYRAHLPPGASAVLAPEIDGEFDAWLDGRPMTFDHGAARLAEPALGAVLAIRVEAPPGAHALLKPIRIQCAPVEQPLISWTEQNLDWYSGRCLYSTEFGLTEDHRRDDVRLVLDLGKVCYCAEIWLNGELVGSRVWPPYRLDITKHARTGRNRLDVIVANLLANRMHWDIFDDVKGTLLNRKWHDGNLLRDSWCFESGLLGPVRIIPMRNVTLAATDR
jgi:hypothetical protein